MVSYLYKNPNIKYVRRKKEDFTKGKRKKEKRRNGASHHLP